MINIDGKINGYKFKVKPESLKALKLDKELRQDLKEWQEEHNAEFQKYMKENQEKFNSNEIGSLDDMPDFTDWREDEEFRAKRWKKMADACMEFEKEPPSDFWASDEIEYGVIDMAWDFFTGARKVPNNMSLR